jgi:hypothetical protein
MRRVFTSRWRKRARHSIPHTSPPAPRDDKNMQRAAFFASSARRFSTGGKLLVDSVIKRQDSKKWRSIDAHSSISQTVTKLAQDPVLLVLNDPHQQVVGVITDKEALQGLRTAARSAAEIAKMTPVILSNQTVSEALDTIARQQRHARHQQQPPSVWPVSDPVTGLIVGLLEQIDLVRAQRDVALQRLDQLAEQNIHDG